MNTPAFDLAGIHVIIGLGNPGPKFHTTRHNIGFLFLDYVAESHHAAWRTVGNFQLATIQVHGREIPLIKPQTFMNNSGEVWSWIAKRGIKAAQVWVVHDELEKKFGTYQIRQGGSARGHNGLRSLIARCGEDFWRLRLGIDRPEDKNTVPDYVLKPFPAQEMAHIPTFFASIVGKIGL